MFIIFVNIFDKLIS